MPVPMKLRALLILAAAVAAGYVVWKLIDPSGM